MESTAAVAEWEDGEWELCNDDGFVYKRRKRRRLDPVAEPASAQSASISDPEADERQRRERKKKTLLKLKEQYQMEIDQWQHLSNTLRAMEETTRKLQHQRVPEQTAPSDSSSLPEVQSTESVCGSLVNKLLLQAESQEAIIRNVSNLCDIAEAMCNAEEEQLNQSLIDLPIWSSPRELMASLCDQ
ncbi:hypothetical protein FNV43_RR14250 [Rhamnella rubrinervis]|uniref:Uncharacterized protein n=1 Tax=Rhamnella rubrinervis TaxID=2594499 RepID=A0A8K0H2Q2_9ROSA|nr:hypothetical protein FNV43_RR14250 [Rhamnella rubrinervis]